MDGRFNEGLDIKTATRKVACMIRTEMYPCNRLR